jgi:hypothetical protein
VVQALLEIDQTDCRDEGQKKTDFSDIDDKAKPLRTQSKTDQFAACMVRAFTLHHAEQWEPDADDGLHHRAFMEAVCVFAGVVPVPTDAA